jgi:hypothetical protein
MSELSLKNIEDISIEIRQQEITFSYLADELIDHICCDVEYEMQNGLSFTDAYGRVKQKMGSPRRIKEIQEETLYAVDTKYRIMKNLMKISGVAGMVLLGIGVILKIEHFPGAGILMSLGALIVAFLFLPSSLGVLWKETRNKKSLFLLISAFLSGVSFIFGTLFKIQHWPGAGWVLLAAAFSFVFLFMPALLASKLTDPGKKRKRPIYILGTIGIIGYVIGILFKIQHWPMATVLMVSGVILLAFIVFPWYTSVTWKEERHLDPRFTFLVIGSLLIIIPGVMINLNLQGLYETGYYSYTGKQQILYNWEYGNNLSQLQACHESESYPKLEAIHQKTNGLLILIANIQRDMIAESEGKPGLPSINPLQVNESLKGIDIKYARLSKPFLVSPVKDFLFPGSGTREELDQALADYLSFLSGQVSPGIVNVYKNMLDPAILLPSVKEESNGISMISGLHSLELLRNSVLAFESNIIAAVVNSNK